MVASTRGWALNNFFGHQGRRRLFEVVSLFESIRTYKTILKLNPVIGGITLNIVFIYIVLYF